MNILKCCMVPLASLRLRVPTPAMTLGRPGGVRALMGALLIMAAPVALGDPTAQWVMNQTITSVTDNDYGGEVVQVTVSQTVVPGCTDATAYEIRDANTIKGSLALLTAAYITGQSVNLFITGTCDSSGNPNVTAVELGNP
jgi:hypothetical protein